MTPRWIALVATAVALTSGCGDSNLGGSGTGSSGGLDGESGTGTATPPGSTTTTGGDATTGGDGGGACGDPIEGMWGDCVNDGLNACENLDSTCLQSRLNDPLWGVCSLECTDACDCWAAHPGGTAQPACMQTSPGEMRCVLDCNDGAKCPVGMRCVAQTASIRYCVYDNDNPPDTGTGTGDTGGSDTGGTSTGS